ncbi:MAG TPA: hypothetical protein VNB22_12045 [Pyrinomonadaceae bacterium]|nr:hypothetical protein [Pyrinomonadaceae bacterium]
MERLTIILLLIVQLTGACFFSSNKEKTNSADTKNANNLNVSAEKSNSGAGSNQADKKETASKTPENADCFNIKLPTDKKLDKKQTFAFDHEPFKNACFVTIHDAEYDDPPLNSEFFIYKDGKQVYKFPNQFNGVTIGCWAEGVAFQDLNEDGLTDIIIAGMCSAKSAPYSENMVYVNKGKEFMTNEDANYTLEKFKKIKDIADFVKQNREQFFQ